MQETPIGWTDFSGNLIKYRDPDGNVVNACIKASEGCRHCYAETLAPRWGRKGKPFTAQNMKRLTPFFDEKEAKAILGSKKISGKRFFHGDMTDWMGPWVSSDLIDRCLATFAERSDVTFQTLTKHAKRQREYFTDSSLEDRITELWQGDDEDRKTWNVMLPLENLHVGVSVEDQPNALKRIPELISMPAAVKWVSVEPMLGAVDLGVSHSYQARHGGFRSLMDDLNGIVIGGESGPGHREMPLPAALMLAESARAAGVAVYFKQDSGARPGKQGRVPDDIWALKDWPTQ